MKLSEVIEAPAEEAIVEAAPADKQKSESPASEVENTEDESKQ